MRTVFELMLCALVCVGMMGSSALADEPSDKMAHRWGLGWDDGLGMRYRLSENTGVGFNLKIVLTGQERDDYVDTDTAIIHQNPIETNKWDILASVLLYRDVRLAEWIDVGPYLSIGFGYGESDQDRNSSVTHSWENATNRRFECSVGIRPSFTYKDRFVLESRFGFGVRYLGSRSSYDSVGTYGESHQRRNTDDWSGFTFGEELGPGSVLQFIIYF